MGFLGDNQADTLPDKETAQVLLVYMLGLGVDKQSALVEACREGNIELVRVLIASETVRLEFRDGLPLSAACEGGQLEVVNLILDVFDEAYALYTGSVRGLRNAYTNGHPEVVDTLLSRCFIGSRGYDVLLKEACRLGDLDAVKGFVSKGADVCCNENEALKIACDGGFIGVVHVLLKAGADSASINYMARRNLAFKGHKNILAVLSKHAKKKK